MNTEFLGDGSCVKWDHNSLMGVTDDETVMLDLDDTPFKTVKYWAQRAMHFFDLVGFLMLKSSQGNYHVVFDRKVTWIDNMSIVASIAIQTKHEGLKKWSLLQARKKASTLRVGPKGEKPSPRIVFREGRHEDQIAEFLKWRINIKKINRQLS